MSDHCCHHQSKKWYQNKLLIITAITALIIGVSYAVPWLSEFRHHLFAYFAKIWWALALGLVIGGIIDHFVPQEHISHFLAKKKKRTILYSTILGFFMSACSHGILAIAIQLYKKGASVPAVIAFLLASPWANLTFTIMLIGFFGLTKALYIIGVSLVIAVLTGLIFQVLDHFHLVESNQYTRETQDDFSIVQDIRARWQKRKASGHVVAHDIKGVFQGVISLTNMVGWWLMIGLVLAAAIAAYVPSEIFQDYLGPHTLGLVITLIFATVIEVCSEGSAPIAYEIFRQTGALGNAFVFLMAGVATDYTEIGLLWANIGRKTAIWLPVVTVPQILFWGVIANMIF